MKNNQLKLSQSQKRIWLSQMINPNSTMFLLGGYNLIYGNVNTELLNRAICNVINSFDIFHMSIENTDFEPELKVMDEISFECKMYDFSHDRNQQNIFQDWVKQWGDDIQIQSGKLYDLAIFKLQENIYGYIGKFHHLIADGWTMQLLSEGIEENYRLLAHGNDIFPKRTYDYINFLKREEEYLQSDKYLKDREYWVNKLGSIQYEKMEGLGDLSGKRKNYLVDENRKSKIMRICSNNQTSVLSLFMTFTYIFYHKTYRNEDIILGLPVYSRVGRLEKSMAGMCVNHILSEVHIDGNMTVSELIKNVTNTLKSDLKHYQYPVNHLLNELHEKQIYHTCINYYNTEMSNYFDDLKSEFHEIYSGEQEYGLQLVIRQWKSDASMTIEVDYQSGLYSDLYIDSMIKSMYVMMDQMDNSKEIKLKDMELVDRSEIQECVLEKTHFPHSILDLFLEQVKKNPNQNAVCDAHYKLTYAEFDQRTDMVSSYLQSLKISENNTVGIWCYNSIDVLVAIWGSMKAGIAYLPIDYNTPVERVKYMLEDSKTQYILTNFHISKEITNHYNVISLPEDFRNIPTTKQVTLSPLDERLVYTIYTSGSTGKPKGVMLSEKAVKNYIMWAKKMYITKEKEVFPLYSSIAFDLTVTTILLPLVCGGTIEIYDNRDKDNIVQRILEDNVCTIAKFTPAHLILMSDYDNRNCKINKLIVGGENLTVELCKRVVASFGRDIDIYNEYGPTEAAVGCAIYRYDENKDLSGSVPIGKVIDNNVLYLLDQYQKVVPKGIKGEIYIGGDSVAKGYLNQPDLTAKRFLMLSDLSPTPVYRTGDLAESLEDDNLVYLGRADNQIKINGYRIELDEIDKSIMKFDGIKWAKTLPISMNESKVLVAYYQENNDVNTRNLKEFLNHLLPSYCVPSIYMKLDQIPLTRNGKIDINKLPISAIPTEQEQQENLTEKESVLLKAVMEVMNQKITLNQNFYFQGGDSIKAIQIASRMKEYGYHIKVKDILENPEFKDMADYIREESLKNQVEESSGTLRQLPILNWFTQANIGNKNRYCQMMDIKVNNVWKREDLSRIIQMLIQQHDSFRLNYDPDNNEFIYKTFLEEPELVIEHQLDDLKKDEQELFIKKEKEKLLSTMSLQGSSLIRSCVFRNQLEGDTWFIVVHHIAIDGVSWRIVLHHIQILMNQITAGQELKLPTKGVSYQEWCNRYYDRVQLKRKHEDLKLPIYKDIKDEGDNYNITVRKFKLDENLTTQLISDANIPFGTKTEDLLVASVTRAMYELTGEENVLFEMESQGRGRFEAHQEVNDTIGWFTELYPVSIQNSTSLDSQLIINVKETIYKEKKNNEQCTVIDDWSYQKKSIRFNYLGDSQYNTHYFSAEFDELALDGDMTCLLEINCILVNNIMNIFIKGDQSRFLQGFMGNFETKLERKIRDIINICMDEKIVVATPSDFKNVELTMEDMNILFNG